MAVNEQSPTPNASERILKEVLEASSDLALGQVRDYVKDYLERFKDLSDDKNRELEADEQKWFYLWIASQARIPSGQDFYAFIREGKVPIPDLPNGALFLCERSLEDRSAWDAVAAIINEFDKMETGIPFPYSIVAARAVRGEKPPKRKKAPNSCRELQIRAAVEMATLMAKKHGFEMEATRSDDREVVSACDIVAACTGKSFKTIKNIWSARDNFPSQEPDGRRR